MNDINSGESQQKRLDQIRETCINYLVNLLQTNNNKINWENLGIPELVPISCSKVESSEENTDLFSTIYGVELKDDIIYVTVLDYGELNIQDVSTSELYALCDFLFQWNKELNLNIYGESGDN